MSFKWDWEKKELLEGERPKGLSTVPESLEMFIIPTAIAFGYWFIEYVAPWLGHILLGGFL